MSWLDDFDCETVTNVKITGLGSIVSFDSAGQPVYGVGAVKYDEDAIVDQLSSSEVLANDKINSPSSHMVILDPAKVAGTLIASDTCEITLNGIATQFKMNTPDNALGMDDMIQFTAIKKVTS